MMTHVVPYALDDKGTIRHWLACGVITTPLTTLEKSVLLRWLCHVGRAAEDGDFESFCRAVMQTQPQADGLAVHWTAPTGQQLAFAW